jgi:hypothetical protein
VIRDTLYVSVAFRVQSIQSILFRVQVIAAVNNLHPIIGLINPSQLLWSSRRLLLYCYYIAAAAAATAAGFRRCQLPALPGHIHAYEREQKG